jgi:sodium/bile acid cotransporter 7
MSFVLQEASSLPTLHKSAISPASQQSIDEEMNTSSSSVPTEQKQDENDEDGQKEGEKEEDEDEVEVEETEEEEEKSRLQRLLQSLFAFYVTNQFPIHIMLSILLARAYPPLGADYLQPDITATWIAVTIIFFLSGMGIKTEEFSKAFQRYYFNGFVQCFNFFFVSIVVFAVSRLLTVAHMLDANLADGMVICACLPMAINVVIVLSSLTGADEAAAVFNSAIGTCSAG